HLRQVRALAAEQRLHRRIARELAAAEPVNPLLRHVVASVEPFSSPACGGGGGEAAGGGRSCSIASQTPFIFSNTSGFVTRRTRHPARSKNAVRRASFANCSGIQCVAPSTSTTNLAWMHAKS